MPVRTFSLTLKTVPPVAKRKKHVLILLHDQNNHYLLGTKDVYPPGIYRMVGGGMEKGETPLQSAVRELHEELQIAVPEEDLQVLGTVVTHIASGEEKFIFTSHIFFLELKDHGIVPNDDLDGVVHIDPIDCEGLLQRYKLLSPVIDYVHKFSWFDYGQIYGPIHAFAFQQAKKITYAHSIL